MATLSDAHAVKSLNKGPSRRRFVFKTFSQKLDDIDINVWRSLEKQELPRRSSYFLDCLVEWRELNTAEDFITFYDEMMPYVQTLPLLILHKELILSKLLSNLHMKARLSLEPILRLIAALSRDLQKDFLFFLDRIADSLVCLLKCGADREPEIIEQIFVSWSYILMYLKEYLVKEQMIVHVLEVTRGLRYYPKGYIQEFMANTTAFLLRSASVEQFKRGIRTVMLEIGKEPLALQKSGVSALLYYAMRGTSSRFHSKAKWILMDLIENSDDSLLCVVGKFDKGADTIIEVLTTTLQRLCEGLGPAELNDIWNCICQKIDDCVANEDLLHLSYLLSLLISTVHINSGAVLLAFQPVLECVKSLVQRVILHIVVANEDHLPKVIDKVLQLMLCILDGLNSSNDVASISSCSVHWAPVFELRNSSFLTFITELLEKDPRILFQFRVNVLRAINNLIETSWEEVIGLLLCLCERLQMEPLRSSFFHGISEEGSSEIHGLFLNIHGFLQGAITFWVGVINDLINGSNASTVIGKSKLAQLWGMTSCYPWLMETPKNPGLLMDLINALDRLLAIDAEKIAGAPKHAWQSLLGAALSSYYKCGKSSELKETTKVLHLAETYKMSARVLSAVADYLDYVHGTTLEADTGPTMYHPEFGSKRAEDMFSILADNLCNAEKGIRVSTLRILCHYEPQGFEISTEDQRPWKKLKTEAPQTHRVGDHGIDVLHLLLSIEKTSLSPYSSTEAFFSKIQGGLSAGMIPEAYIPIVLSGIIGIFHNRFSDLWKKASECLVVLIGKYFKLVWDKFVYHFQHCQTAFQMSHDKLGGNTDLFDQCSGLVNRFNSFIAPASDSTPCGAVLSSLLQSLQKIPFIAGSRTHQIITWFLEFLGYNSSDLISCSVGSFNSDACKGKEWKRILREWLNLLKLIPNPKAFDQIHFVKDVLVIRIMDENDSEIQMKVLDCLVNWKVDFVLPYEHHLRNLIISKNLREVLTTWSLSSELQLIEESHRGDLVNLVILLLMPKVRKLKLLGTQKRASVHHRKSVLRFIAQLDVNEIPFFFALLMKPLFIKSNGADAATSYFWNLPKNSLDKFQPSQIFEHFTIERIMALSWKKRSGFLHVIEDVLGVFDESHVIPFLDLLMGCVVRVLGSCSSSLNSVKGACSCQVVNHSTANVELYEKGHKLTSTAVKQLKDMRSLCLRIISSVLNEYDHHDFGQEFWDLFFASVKPLIDSFKLEGSSSEKPSSLFSCFLAMSRSLHLVPQLCREKNLASDIFSILTIPTASEAIISYVLVFIENLVNLDNELDSKDDVDSGLLLDMDEHIDVDHDIKDDAVQKVLLPNLDELINSLHHLFRNDNPMYRRFPRYPGQTQLRIFQFLSRYVKDQAAARKFVDILLLLLARRVKDSDFFVACLQVVQDMIPVLGNESSSKILTAVSPLLTSVGLDMRLCICDLLDTLAKTDPSILYLANLLREFNATSATDLDGLDYGVIIKAHEKISSDNFFNDVQEDHALVVLSHCVYDISSDELILRHSAYGSLVSFVKFSAKLLRGEGQKECEVMTTNSKGCLSKACIQRLINKFLMRHVANAMKSGSSVKKEWFALLREMVLNLPKLESLNLLSSKQHDDEQDFFKNIVHIQTHRRARAVLRFKDVITKINVSEGILRKIFVPLFFNMLLDAQNGKGEQIKTACLKAIASIAACMKWKSYHALLNMCFQETNLNLEKQKILLRLICNVLDEFHFGTIYSSPEIKDSLGNISGMDTTVTSSMVMLHKGGTSSLMVTEIQAYLLKILLPKIQTLLDSDSDKVNVDASVAAMKVLKLLPENVMDSQLPNIIHRIANHLKSRLESIRDEARRALADCLKELGPEYLQFIVRVLRASLKRGFELHVLGYSLNFVLSKFLSNLENGRLDYCLDDILSVVENDILGDVGEEKEVGKIASKMKETRKQKSFETLKMIAQCIKFNNRTLRQLLSPIRDRMQGHLTPKVKTKLENMLNQIAAGIECNPSVDQTDLFVSVYGLLIEDDGVNGKNVQGDNSSDCSEAFGCHRSDEWRKAVSSGPFIGTTSVYSHLIQMFALGLFHNRIKSLRLDKSDGKLLSLLDPFIALLGSCLSSEYGDIVSACLRCLTPLVRLPLPSLASQADKIKVIVLDIAQSSIDANSPLMQSCLRLLTVLMRSNEITLSSDQSRMLIQFPLFVDLERNPSFVALSLLKSVVKRKPIAHDIYAVIHQIEKLMITSQEESIRKKCSQILWQFLRYHLSETNFLKHYNFLLNNLSYEYSTGREAALEMLQLMINNVSESFLVEHGKTSFVRLVVCLANDSENKIRSMVGSVIKLLIGRVIKNKGSDVLHFILDSSISWYKGAKQQLRSPGAQVLGLLVEVMNERFEGYIGCVLPVSRNILQSALNTSDGTDYFWKEAYYTLVMLEKILQHFRGQCFEKDLEDIWAAICELLLHPHTWLRNISSRLVAFYFSTATDHVRENHERSWETFFLMRPSRLFMIAVSFCCQLKTQVIDDVTGNLITGNLSFIVHSLMRSTEHINISPSEFWSTLDQHEQGQFIKAFRLLDSRKGRGMVLYVSSGVHAHAEKFWVLLLSSLLGELGKIALQMETIQMKIVFNCFARILSQINHDGSQINQDDLKRYAFDMLTPLCKARDGFAGKVIPDDTKQLAIEVCESIEKAIGSQRCANIWDDVRKHLKVKRDKRKEEEKRMAVINPMRNAKRKLRIAAKHRAHKKRKIMTLKMGRWMR